MQVGTLQRLVKSETLFQARGGVFRQVVAPVQEQPAQSLDSLPGIVIMGLSGQFSAQIVEPFAFISLMTWKRSKVIMACGA